MRLFSNKPFCSVPINTLRSVFLNNRNYTSPSKNPNPNFKPFTKSSMATTLNPNNEGLANRFWIRFSKESILSLYTPFVVSLASGNLKLDTFRHYIAQDVHFLKSFAQAYELAEEYTDDNDAKASISELKQSVLEELEMHTSFCQEWGFDVSKETNPNSATLKYTDFLLTTASGKIEGVNCSSNLTTPFEKTKIAAYTISAMVPCMRLYAFLGNELQFFVDINGNRHPYKKWIDNYSSEAFQAAACQTEELLDKLSVSLTVEEVKIMQKLYQQAMKLEMEFFLAQTLHQSTVVPLLEGDNRKCKEYGVTVFSDFDLTCTVVDSCAILAEIAIATRPKSDQSQSEITRIPLAELRNTWERLSKEYLEGYEQCKESMLVNQKVENFDYDGLKKALKQLSDFEKRSNMKVIESKVLKGLNLEDIKSAGESLILQDNCLDFFHHITKNENLNVDAHVLSFCWCGDLIRSAFSSRGIHNLQIHANEFIYERDECEKKNMTIYIGDSVGDLLCLLEADIGIVIGSNSSLRKVGGHFGVSFVPLFHGVVMKQREGLEGAVLSWNGLSGIVYTVSSWAEIHSFIVGS